MWVVGTPMCYIKNEHSFVVSIVPPPLPPPPPRLSVSSPFPFVSSTLLPFWLGVLGGLTMH